MDLISERLDSGHVVSSFSCGNEDLDRWLRNSAQRGEQQKTGRTYVIHEGDKEVLGYYTLAVNALHRDTLSRKQGRGLPEEIPAILLAKLAVDESLKGQGYGAGLLLEALELCVSTSKVVGCRFVIVDAIDESAATFYEHHGFQRVPDSKPVRLLQKIVDIEASLEAED